VVAIDWFGKRLSAAVLATSLQQQQQQQQFISRRRLSLALSAAPPKYINSRRECSAPQLGSRLWWVSTCGVCRRRRVSLNYTAAAKLSLRTAHRLPFTQYAPLYNAAFYASLFIYQRSLFYSTVIFVFVVDSSIAYIIQ